MPRQQGYILLPVVLLISLVATAAFMLNNESVLETNVTVSNVEIERAKYVADAGMQHALWQVKQASCGPYTDISGETFGHHSYSSTITPNSVGGSISTFTVGVTDDAWIKSDTPTQNYGTDAQLTTYVGLFPTTTQRTLYRFDIAAAGIPAGEMIVSAVARIFVLDSNSLASVTAHRITANWTEAAVTWDNINSHHDSSSIASIPMGSSVGQYVDVNITSLVQGWVNGSIANQGIILKTAFVLDLAQYTSKEHGTASERPELIIKVADGSLSNRVDISATGILSNGITLSKTRSDIRLYQPTSTVVLQSDAAQGKDNWLYEWKSSWNYGADNEIWVENRYANSIANGLFEFELGGIPAGVKVLSASLALHQNTPSLDGGTIGVHRMASSWVEGIKPGGAGASNWNEKDSGVSWATAGGDYDSTAVSSTVVTASTIDWFEWDISSLVQGWVDGDYENYGLALVAEVFGTAAHFDSSDHTDSTLRPKLTITYACECGVTCQSPQGSGNILLAVGDAVTLASADVKKQSLFESWGYTVNLIDDDADQATFDAALASNDVAYISETVWGPTLATKLADTDKGVVNEEENQNSYLGLSSSGSNTVGDSMEVIDNSHYITALFSNGAMPIFNAPMEGLLVTGTSAPGLQILGNFSGTASLALVDVGDALGGAKSGENAAGRRVVIPVGSSDKFNWDYLNNNGLLIVQRAIQWGTSNTTGAPVGNLLLVVGNAASPAGKDTGRIALMESWNYVVTLIDDGDTQANFDAAATAADVVYVSGTVDGGLLQNKLTGSSVPIVNESPGKLDNYGFSSATTSTVSADTFSITNAAHFITEPFAGNPVTVFTGSISMPVPSGTLAPGLQNVAEVAGTLALVTLDSAATRWDGNPAPARRAFLPFASAEAGQLSTDGETILKRSLEWAASSESSCTADFVPDTNESEFDTSGLGISDPWGITFLSPGTVFNGVTVPAEGAWLMVDGSSSNFILTDMTGSSLTSVAIPLSEPRGVAYLSSGLWANHLAIANSAGMEIYFLDMDAGIQGLFSTASFTDSPVGVTVIENSAGGVYDGYIAVSSDKDGSGSSNAGVYIVDQSGTLQVSIDTSGFATEPWGLAHIPGKDKFLVADKSGTMYIVGFDGTLLDQYSVASFGATQPQSVAINLLSSAHAVLDKDNDKVINLTLSTCSGGGGAPPPAEGNYLDQFNTIAYNGSDGSLDWTPSLWQESNESDGTSSGILRVVSSSYCTSGNCFRIGHSDIEDQPDISLLREANLSSATTATLSYDFAVQNIDNDGNVYVEVSDNGGANWNTLAIYGRSSGSGSESFDISSYIASNTRLRFRIQGKYSMYLYVDDVKITLDSGGGGGPEPGSCNGTFRDEFNVPQYDQNDGTLNWATDWEETGESSNPTAGDISIDNDEGSYELKIRDDGQTIMREADLSQAGEATLGFDYWRKNLNGASDYVAVEVSYDGGSYWIELDRFTGDANDSAYSSTSYTLEAGSLSINTRIRFLTPSSGMSNSNLVLFDNVQIQCSP